MSSASLASPQPVSPSGRVATRCPTFSWSVGDAAAGYELVVFGVTRDGEAGREPVLRATLPGGVGGWTPSVEQCLGVGERYAWTVRASGAAEEGWSEPVLFEVDAGPGPDEVEAALRVLERYLAERDRDDGGDGTDRLAELQETGRPTSVTPRGSGKRHDPRSIAPSPLAHAGGEGGGAEDGTGTGVVRTVQAAAPALGNPSLRLTGNLALSTASSVFKNDSVFLWDDTTGNTALGRLALSSATGTATNNTAVGRRALRDTQPGDTAIEGSFNTAVGDSALRSNTTGRGNTASGYAALRTNKTGFLNTASGYFALNANTTGDLNTACGAAALRGNTTGHRNTACGARALFDTSTGSRNTGVGYGAGSLARGSDNIFLGARVSGQPEDEHTIRIGATGTDDYEQNRTFIAGIRGITTGLNNAVTVMIDGRGQLGTVSSSAAVKQDIAEIGDVSRRLLALRPVSFRYRQHAAQDPDTPVQYGLIAEEVAEVFPELVVYDEESRPQTVKYHLLAPLLLHELQRAERELDELRKRLHWLERRERERPRGRRATRVGR